MIEKVGVYCRLSDEDRDKINKNDDSNSIINQRSMCLKYANQCGWNVVDIYSDDDFSGAGTYRPDFERLIKRIELLPLQTIVMEVRCNGENLGNILDNRKSYRLSDLSE